MQPLNVAIVAVEDFSPFHFSVPCIIFSDKVASKKRFEVQLCAEQPGIVSSQDGFAITAAYGYEAVEAADIVVIPGGAPRHIDHHKACLIRSAAHDKTARKLLGYVWARLFSAMPVCWMANGQLRTGSSSRIFRRAFRRPVWISTRYTWMTTVLLPRQGPPPRWIAACTSSASVLAARWRIRLPDG